MKQFLKDWWFIPAICLGICCLIVWAICDIYKTTTKKKIEKDYCGSIIDKGYDPPSSGYKTHLDEQYWVIIKDDQVHKAVRVHVTPACYYDNEKGDHVCFSLSGDNMQKYGNTTNFEHLK